MTRLLQCHLNCGQLHQRPIPLPHEANQQNVALAAGRMDLGRSVRAVWAATFHALCHDVPEKMSDSWNGRADYSRKILTQIRQAAARLRDTEVFSKTLDHAE
jgi:hypothetical protein